MSSDRTAPLHVTDVGFLLDEPLETPGNSRLVGVVGRVDRAVGVDVVTVRPQVVFGLIVERVVADYLAFRVEVEVAVVVRVLQSHAVCNVDLVALFLRLVERLEQEDRRYCELFLEYTLVACIPSCRRVLLA